MSTKIAFAALLAGWMILAPAADASRPERPPAAGLKQPYTEVAETLRVAGLSSEGAYAMLARLTGQAPNRLTGSPGFAAASELMKREMTALGLETWNEPVRVEHWVRGEVQEAAIAGASGIPALRIAALGLSVPTPEKGISAPVLEVRSFDDLGAAGARAKNAIVFFNHPMNPALMDTFTAYGEAAQYRTRGASEAAKLGAAAVLVRSVTLRLDGFPHGGMVGYEPGVPKIPAAAVCTFDADVLSLRLREQPGLQIRLRLDCRELPPADSSNLVGQMRGTEKPEEIVLLGAHLDSWDLGTGAHDDGAGCVHCLEAVRLIRALGLRPKRTIRIVLYPNEEFGASAGRDYAESARRAGEKTIAAIESDRGGFLPMGFGFGPPEIAAKLGKWESLLRPSGILWTHPGGGGADVGPLAEHGAALLSFMPDNQRYFDFHHSANDVLAAVHPRELELGAIVTAIMAYLIAEEGI